MEPRVPQFLNGVSVSALWGLTVKLIILLSLSSHLVQAVCPSGCACDDDNLHVNCVDANLDFVPITLNPFVQKLLLRNNRIRSIEAGFAFYHELNFIDLSHNHLLKISHGSFSTQTKLIELHLNNNKITSLSNHTFGGGPGSSGTRGLPSLIHLNLRVNLLDAIEPGIFLNTRNLEELNLGENSIREINSSAFLGLDRLRILRLDRNELRQVPRVFKMLQNGTIPQFGQFHGYQTTSPSVSMSHLVELFLGLNPIDSLEKNAFSSLINLAMLDLKGCHLSTIDPEAFRGLTQLKTLVLADNNLKAVPSVTFPPLRQLEILKLGRNPIPIIPAYSFSSLRLLKILQFKGAPDLESVDVAAFISNLDLEVIEISSAKRLHSLPAKLFKGMSSLRNLVLKENALINLPEDLASWQSLRELRLEGNPFQCSCDFLWLRDVLALPRFKNSSFLVLCDEPKAVHEKRISSLTEEDLDCYLNGPIQKTLLGVAIAIVVLLLAIFFCLLYKYHDKIKNSCKRSCWRRGRNSGLGKSSHTTHNHGRGNSSSATVKASELLDSSTKTSFLSQSSAYPYTDEEYALRTSLMSRSPPPDNYNNGNGHPYSSHTLNLNTLHRQFPQPTAPGMGNYPIQSLTHPYHHNHHPHHQHSAGGTSYGGAQLHSNNGTLLLPPHYGGEADYETPINLGIGSGHFTASNQPHHHYASPINGLISNGHQQPPSFHYNSHQQVVKPIPVTEL